MTQTQVTQPCQTLFRAEVECSFSFNDQPEPNPIRTLARSMFKSSHEHAVATKMAKASLGPILPPLLVVAPPISRCLARFSAQILAFANSRVLCPVPMTALFQTVVLPLAGSPWVQGARRECKQSILSPLQHRFDFAWL